MRDIIDRLLAGAGIDGRVDSAETLIGRNANLAVTLDTGAMYFAKQFRPGGAQRFERIVDFESRAAAEVVRPELIAHSREDQVLVYRHLGGAEGAGVRLRERRLPVEAIADIGSRLGHMHRVAVDGLSDERHAQPPLDMFGAIPIGRFLGMSAGELEMIRILQNDGALARAAHEIREQEAAHDYVARCIHADLRLDQVMLVGERVYLTDFEDVRAGDPARDLGSFIGDLLFSAFVTIPQRISSEEVSATASHDDIMRCGGEALDEIMPSVHAFVRGYAEVAGDLDEATSTRTVRFAGWHMFDRMFASSEASFRVDGVIRAAAGIGRNLLLEPTDFLDIIEPRKELTQA